MKSLFEDARFYFLIGLIIAVISVGTVFYGQVEGLSLIDSIYFSAMTLTTVGYGDIVPQTDSRKIFAIVYTFVGLGLILTLFKIVADHATGHLKLVKTLEKLKLKK